MYVKEIQENVEFKGMKQRVNKVPMVTLYFWIIKIFCILITETSFNIITNDILYEEMSKKSLELVQKHDINKTLKSFEEIYQNYAFNTLDINH